jgi:16S rRNA (guanine1207-N2)-methyltransferase
MTPELDALNTVLSQAPTTSLWCADENIGDFVPPVFNGSIISNRLDIAQHLQHTFTHTLFNDFDFSSINTPIEQVIFRIAKEKAINLHIIHQAIKYLAIGQSLILVGYKNEGINSLCSYIKDNFAVNISIDKHKAQLQSLHIALLEKPAKPVQTTYPELQQLNIDEFSFISKPGVFGWNKIDKGSELLMQAFAEQSIGVGKKQLLDLGCGYGYLSIYANKLGFNDIDATDNNAAALLACQANFDALGINGEVFADNFAENRLKKYDIILCNPPFHQGFDHKKKLTEVSITQAHKLLKPHGVAFFVTNQFIGIEKFAKQLFESSLLLEKSGGFKVYIFKKM